jgi:outer membrane protein assembly factor BamB
MDNRRRLLFAALIGLAGLVALSSAFVIPEIATAVTPKAVTAQSASQTAVSSAEADAYQIGVSHNGYSGDTTILPPLAHRWSHTFTGPVSYPLIADGKVFVTVADTGGISGSNLYALNQATGAILWSQPLGGTYNWSNAAYDAGRVFAVNSDGLMQAFDAATGSLDWSAKMPGQYLFSSPPTASGGIVYTGGAGSGGTVYAVSESNGALLWTQPVENGDHSSPALSGSGVFVSYACGLVYAFDPVSGTRQWFSNGPCEGGGGKTPVYNAGLVYARDPINGNKILNASTGALVGTFQADPAPAFDGNIGLFLSAGTLRAIEGGTTLWSFAGDGGLDTAPIAVGGTVYEGSSSGMLYGLNAASGKVVWSTNVGSGIPAPDEQNISQPLTGLGAGQGLLVVPAGDQLAAYSTTGQVTGYGNLALDDYHSGNTNGTPVDLDTPNGTGSQHWTFNAIEDSNGNYTGELVNSNGMCVNDAGYGGSGSKVILWSCTGTSNEEWTYWPTYKEYSVSYGGHAYCMNDPGYSTTPGVQQIVWTCPDTANEQYTLPH